MCAPLSEFFRSCLPIREIYDDVTFNRKVVEGPAIGIDLGTTYSCVGYWKSGRVEIIANEQGSRTTPSYVAFTDNHRLIGDGAYNQAALNPTNTVFDAKRLIGRKFSDESVQSDRKLWPFKVVSGRNQKPMISVTYKGAKKEFAAEEISSMVLARMNQIAEAFIGSEVKGVVITVPAYFDQSQRQATMDAGKIAGINVLQILNEPTAAAIAYGLDHTSGKKNVLIFDLGGGTFDVAVLSIEADKVEVKAIAGDTHLGGEDFDNRVVNHFIKEFKRKHSKDISKNPKAVRKLRTACERGKRLLSYSSEARIDIDGLFEGIDFSAILSRSKFDELNSDLFNKCIERVEQCLRDANTNKKVVDDVVLVGGSSRILKVQKLVRDFFDGKEICKSINPDEAVAYGAAVQAAILTGQPSQRLENLVLVDVTPLSLGVKVVGDVMYVVIPRNTTIPARKTKRNLSTVLDNQTSIDFSVYEGERTKASANKLIGHFILTGIKPAPRTSAKIDLYFDLQANGMLRVTARNVDTGKEESITVTNGSLSQKEVETMIEDANKYKVDDDKHKMKGEARTSFENYILEMRENIRRRNVYSYEKKKAEIAIEQAFEWLDSRVELAEVHEYEEQKEQLIKSLESC